MYVSMEETLSLLLHSFSLSSLSSTYVQYYLRNTELIPHKRIAEKYETSSSYIYTHSPTLIHTAFFLLSLFRHGSLGVATAGGFCGFVTARLHCTRAPPTIKRYLIGAIEYIQSGKYSCWKNWKVLRLLPLFQSSLKETSSWRAQLIKKCTS